MRWAAFGVVGFLSIGTAWAQNGGSEVFVPPAPPVMPEVPSAAPPVQPAPPAPPPGLVQGVPDGTALSPSTPPDTTIAQPPPPDVAPAPADSWAPGTTAVLGVLNKVDGSTAQLQLAVGGQPQTTGDLSVSVQACLNRPADEIPDVAVFVTVQSVPPGDVPLYRGWMLRSAPGATFVGNAGQTFRVMGCS